MRTKIIYASNPELSAIWNEFKVSQGDLYHYTRRSISQQIQENRELWITRADHFLDKQEVNYGTPILQEIAAQNLAGKNLGSFLSIVKEIRRWLSECYIFSLSSDENNPYLAEIYANQETKIKFSIHFPGMLAHASWHTLPESNSSFSLHYAADIYIQHEGFVEYEINRNEEIATKIINIFKSFVTQESHVADTFQFIKLLRHFVIHAKHPNFRNEKEYRISLVRKKCSIIRGKTVER